MDLKSLLYIVIPIASLFVAGFAAWISFRMLTEMRKERQASFRPYLSIWGLRNNVNADKEQTSNSESLIIDYGNSPSEKLTQLKYPLRMSLKNVGIGPALHVRLKRFEGFNPHFEGEQDNIWFALAPNEEKMFEFWIQHPGDIHEFLKDVANEEYWVVFTFKDAAENEYKAKVKVRFSNVFTHDDYPDLYFYILERSPDQSSKLKNRGFLKNYK